MWHVAERVLVPLCSNALGAGSRNPRRFDSIVNPATQLGLGAGHFWGPSWVSREMFEVSWRKTYRGIGWTGI